MNTDTRTNVGIQCGAIVGTLTPTEKLWYDRVLDDMKLSKQNYTISWWLRSIYGTKTSKINYILNKVVNKGLLKKRNNSQLYKIHFNLIT